MTLTIDQIKDLAEFADLVVIGDVTEDDKETEITINPCPKKGSGRISPNVRFTYLNASGS